MTKKTSKHLTTDGIERILEYLPKFQKKKFSPGKWSTDGLSEEDVATLPVYDYSDIVTEFIKTLYDEGFVYSFDWTHWDYGKKVRQNPELINEGNNSPP